MRVLVHPINADKATRLWKAIRRLGAYLNIHSVDYFGNSTQSHRNMKVQWKMQELMIHLDVAINLHFVSFKDEREA